MATPPPTRELSVSDLTGAKVGRFEVTRRLGAGGMGEVYLATDTRLKRTVVLKRLAPHLRADARYRERLVKEAERASRLDLAHIAAIYDVIEEAGEVFIVMEYVEGSDLRHAALSPHNIQEILAIAVQCAQALAAAHSVGVLHRDIKPENIMLKPDRTVKVLDFGLAREMSYGDPHDETAVTVSVDTQAPAGTAGYVAPEVLLEQGVDARADVFSLGVVFYELLTRRHPFRTESFVGTCDRVLHLEPPPLREVNPQAPPELERIVHKMLAKDRNERYATVADLLVDLRNLERHGTSPMFAAPPARVARRPRWKLWGGIAAAILAVAALIAFFPRPQGTAPGASRELSRQVHLAVLPVRFIGGSAEQGAMGEGLAETLSVKFTRLSAQRELQVAPASEVHANNVRNAEQARQHLGVNTVLEASVLPLGDDYRVTFSLVDTGTKRALAADEFTLPATEFAALEDRVVTGVSQMLKLSVAPREQEALRAGGTAVAQAYELYQRGRGYLQDYQDPAQLVLALQAFDEALKLDPRFASAYAARGEAYWYRYRATHDRTWVRPAQAACDRAAELDANLASAHVCLGMVNGGTGKTDEAVAHFRRALDLDPTTDTAYRGLASAYMALGRIGDAEATYRRAVEVRPHYWASYQQLGYFLKEQARYQEAADAFLKARELAPHNAQVHYGLGGVYIFMGKYADAEAALRKSIEIRPTSAAYSNLGNAQIGLRRYSDAVHSFEQAVAHGKLDWISAWNLGRAYYWAPGRRDDGLKTLRRMLSLAEEQLKVNPRNPDVHILMAYSAAALGERSHIGQHLQMSLGRHPDNAEYLFQAALVHSLLGERQKAVDAVAGALKRGYSRHEIEVAPELDALREETKFRALISAK